MFEALSLLCLRVNVKLKYEKIFVVLRHFQHCTGHIMMGSFVGRGNQYIQLLKVRYCKLPVSNATVSK